MAKVIARAGLASRRDAEAMVLARRVSVNGKTIASPAVNVGPSDTVTLDGKPLPKPEAARVWLYHKPAGLVTTEKDEKGRETVFDALRGDLGRVLSIGRLDLTSEGLLLLTNDGDLKRRLELPETGWLRRYRVRVNGSPDEAALQKLRDGITVDGEAFAPMKVTMDRQQGANAWLTIGLREGRNREIRRATEAVDLMVNRLIRVSYGPFQLGNLAAGEVEEIKPRALRDQLGGLFDGPLAEARRDTGPRKERPAASGDRPNRGPRRDRDDAGPRGPRPRKDGPGGKPSSGPRRDRDGTLDRPREDRKPKGRFDETTSDRPKRDRDGASDRPRDDRKPKGRFGDKTSDRPSRGRDGGPDRPRDDRKPRKDGPDRPFKGPKGRDDRRPDRDGDAADRPKTRAERKAEMRADTSVSLRKGGQRGKGIAKPKRSKGTKPYRKPGADDK
ncbi:MAG: pseudouridine synthase [Pseudomonadota bacterium]